MTSTPAPTSVDPRAHPALASSRAAVLALAAVPLLATACREQLPTASEEGLVPVGTTVEVALSFDQFATGARIYGGYGRPSDLAGGFLARDFAGADPSGVPPADTLNAATLIDFGDFPLVASVRDTTGTTRPDSSLTFLSGRIVANFDADGSVAQGPVRVLAHEVREPWDRITATWRLAVDSLGRGTPWSEPGASGGPQIGSGTWAPASEDSLEIALDSALVAAWSERRDSAGERRSARLIPRDAGSRLKLRSVRLWLDAQPSLAPDTVIQVPAPVRGTTFVYDPPPARPAGTSLRVGGAPAWRSVLDLDVPRRLNGPSELCAAVGCPVDIDEGHVSYAGLVLSPRRPTPAFAPSDSLTMDVRMVLAPSFLPKSPLGPSNAGAGGTPGFAGTILLPRLFADSATDETVEIPVTRLIRDLLRGETTSGDPVPSATVALLSTFEPFSIEYASFQGPGSPAAPRLRLILSFSPTDGG